MDLQHLGNRGHPSRDGIVASGLANLERDERGDLVAERRRIHVGAVSGDHAVIAQPVQAGLHGAGATPSRREVSSMPTLGSAGQQFDERGVQAVIDPGLLPVMLYRDTMFRSAKIVNLTSESALSCAV